jgi:hypothetical protein
LYLLAKFGFIRLLEKPYRGQAQFWTRILRSDRVGSVLPHPVEMVIKLA